MVEVPVKVAFIDRVAAEPLKVRPLRVLLALIAFPFYVLGRLIGLVIVAAALSARAVKAGIADSRAKLPAPAAPPPSAGAD